MTSPIFSSISVASEMTGSASTERIGKRTPITARVRPVRQAGSCSAVLDSTLPVNDGA